MYNIAEGVRHPCVDIVIGNFPVALAIDCICVLSCSMFDDSDLKSGVNLRPGRRLKHGASFRVKPFIVK